VANLTLTVREKQLNEIRAKCQEFDIQSFGTATLQEEQERELSPENEREQQVELPPLMKPCYHKVHQDVRRLVVDGVLNCSSDAFRPAFEIFKDTTACTYYESGAWCTYLLVTTDFASTVCVAAGESLDSFLRPVHWIISCRSGSSIGYVIVSPHEAQELLPSVRKHKKVTLHVYSPRLNYSVRTLEDLAFCAVPPVPKTWPTPVVANQLGLFAGQLYFRTYEDYKSLCHFLGLCSFTPDEQTKIACDSFISSTNRDLLDPTWNLACLFKISPVAFLRAIISFRRKGQSTNISHIGQILNGELVSRDQFEI